jgi:acetyl esterase
VPLDPQCSAYLSGLPGLTPSGLEVEAARRTVEEAASMLTGTPDEVASIEDRAVPGPNGPVRIRIYRPESSEPLPAVVYFHGGGWVVASLDTHDGVCRALARRTPCVVVAVDFRLAPEHRFPVAVEDSWAATAWVWERARELGIRPDAIAVGGDSAGGNLAAVMALRARDCGLPLALQLLVYPVMDHAFDTASYRELGDGTYGLTSAAMEWYWQHYLGPDGDGSNPEASPLRAPDLAGLAPAHVLVAEYDVLLDEGEAYAHRLEQAGVPVTLSRHEGMIHGFFRMTAIIDRAQIALDECATALRTASVRAG